MEVPRDDYELQFIARAGNELHEKRKRHFFLADAEIEVAEIRGIFVDCSVQGDVEGPYVAAVDEI